MVGEVKPLLAFVRPSHYATEFSWAFEVLVGCREARVLSCLFGLDDMYMTSTTVKVNDKVGIEQSNRSISRHPGHRFDCTPL